MNVQPSKTTPTIFEDLSQAIENSDIKVGVLNEKMVELAKMNGEGDPIRNKLRRSLKIKKHKLNAVIKEMKSV